MGAYEFAKKLRWRLLPGHCYRNELGNAISDCCSLLDVGCGSSSPAQHFSKKVHMVGVDAWKPSIKESRKKGIHNKYHQMNILDIGKKFPAKSFDCVMSLDVIEHLTKKDGMKLISAMEKTARKKVIVFTPNGFLPQQAYKGNPWQEHKSGWTVAEMKKRGFEVIGIHGWKPLRGEFADVKYKPKVVWRIISDLTQVLVRNHAEKAFHILCVKKL